MRIWIWIGRTDDRDDRVEIGGPCLFRVPVLCRGIGRKFIDARTRARRSPLHRNRVFELHGSAPPLSFRTAVRSASLFVGSHPSVFRWGLMLSSCSTHERQQRGNVSLWDRVLILSFLVRQGAAVWGLKRVAKSRTLRTREKLFRLSFVWNAAFDDGLQLRRSAVWPECCCGCICMTRDWSVAATYCLWLRSLFRRIVGARHCRRWCSVFFFPFMFCGGNVVVLQDTTEAPLRRIYL